MLHKFGQVSKIIRLMPLKVSWKVLPIQLHQLLIPVLVRFEAKKEKNPERWDWAEP